MQRIPALVAMLLLLAGPSLPAQPIPQADPALADQNLEVGEGPERYAQVKVVEGTVSIRKGETDLPLTRGVPVAEGDVLDSQGRGILQLGDGSAVAFGPATRFKVAALFSTQDQVRRVLLVLDRGELRLRKGAGSDALLRVDTPGGTGILGNPGTSGTHPDASWQVAPDGASTRVIFLVHGGQASFGNGRGETQVYAGQRLTLYGADDGLDRIADVNAFSLDDFDLWAEDLVRPRPTHSASRVPEEIRYYADDLDTGGSWNYVDDVSSWCWTPNDVADDWRPYCDGSWGAFDGGLTWISTEPWGYLTCHHGRWDWRRGLGWYWIPGIYYSPAWVAWNCSGPWFGWAPLGYWNRPSRWGYGSWAGGYAWNVVNLDHAGAHSLRHRLASDPGVLHAFNTSGSGPRPWTQGRLMVTGAEFHDPARFQQVATQPALSQSRVASYTRAAQAATGRTLYRPDPETQGRGAVAFSHLEAPQAAPVRSGLNGQAPFQGQGSFQGPSQRREPAPGSVPRPYPAGPAQPTRTGSGRPQGVIVEGGPPLPPVAPTRAQPVRTPAVAPRQRTFENERPREEARPAQQEERRAAARERAEAPREAPKESPHPAPQPQARPAAHEAPAPRDKK